MAHIGQQVAGSSPIWGATRFGIRVNWHLAEVMAEAPFQCEITRVRIQMVARSDWCRPHAAEQEGPASSQPLLRVLSFCKSRKSTCLDSTTEDHLILFQQNHFVCRRKISCLE